MFHFYVTNLVCYVIILVHKMCHNFISPTFLGGHLDWMINKSSKSVLMFSYEDMKYLYLFIQSQQLSSVRSIKDGLYWDMCRFFIAYMSKSTYQLLSEKEWLFLSHLLIWLRLPAFQASVAQKHPAIMSIFLLLEYLQLLRQLAKPLDTSFGVTNIA